MDLHLSTFESENGAQTNRSDLSSSLSINTYIIEREEAGAGDFTTGMTTEATSPFKSTSHQIGAESRNNDSVSRGDMLTQIRTLMESIFMQEKYIEHQETKRLMNLELLDHIEALTEESNSLHSVETASVDESSSETDTTTEADTTDQKVTHSTSTLEEVREKLEMVMRQTEETEGTKTLEDKLLHGPITTSDDDLDEILKLNLEHQQDMDKTGESMKSGVTKETMKEDINECLGFDEKVIGQAISIPSESVYSSVDGLSTTNIPTLDIGYMNVDNEEVKEYIPTPSPTLGNTSPEKRNTALTYRVYNPIVCKESRGNRTTSGCLTFS